MIAGLVSFLFGLIAMGFGVRCITLPLEAYALIPTLMGIAMLAEGISCIFVWAPNRKESGTWPVLVNGILSAILGIMLLSSWVLQLGIASAYATFVSIWLLISGTIRIVESFQLRSAGKEADDIPATNPEERYVRAALREFSRHWGLALVLGILMVLLGAISLGHPFATMITLGMYIGVDAIMIGVNLIFRAFAVDN